MKRLLSLLLVFILVFSTLVVSADDFLLVDGSHLYVDGGYILGIPAGSTHDEVRPNFREGVDFFGADEIVKTGEDVFEQDCVYSIAIAGDVNGDGKVTSADYLLIKKHFGASITLKDAFFRAGDVSNDGAITSVDYLRVKQYFAGKYDLYAGMNIVPEGEDMEIAKIYMPFMSDEDPIMMSFVIVTKTGKIIVVDGGFDGGIGGKFDYLYNFLATNCGFKNQKFTIDTWFFTHCHADHVDAFSKMIMLHSNVKINRIVCDMIDEDYILSMPDYEHMYTSSLADFNKYSANFNVEVPEVGDKYEIDGLTFEILKTFRQPEGYKYNNINDTSMVFRMSGGGKTLLFLGDLNVTGGKHLVQMYGDDLKSDAVQMAHHGQAGVNEACYQKINPSLCIWATPKWVWESTTLKIPEVRGWMDKLGVQNHYVQWCGWLDNNHPNGYISFPGDF